MKLFWVSIVISLAFSKWVAGFMEYGYNETEIALLEGYGEAKVGANLLMVGLTLIRGAGAKRAVCLDGTLPGYHLHRGYGSGANSWLIQLEVYFFNWNRVKVRYCDGASFTGDSEHKAKQLQFRGERIWLAAMEDLKSKGMRYAKQALLSGCSAGGLAAILHCDKFRGLMPGYTKVKCLSDAGLFLDAHDVSGGHTLRNLYSGIVGLQGVKPNLPHYCTNHLDPTSCFFPQNLISSVKTPLFILNAAYDSWQIQSSLAPPAADPAGYWRDCRLNHAKCTSSQINFLQGFRNQMLNAVKRFSMSKQNGLFINSCFAHCQSERQDTWFADDSPVIGNKAIAIAVGDWYFDRTSVKAVDCPYPFSEDLGGREIGGEERRAMVKFLWVGIVTALVFRIWVDGFVEEKNFDETVPSLLETYGSSEAANDVLMVGLTLVKGAAAKGAVCLDGTVPAYHLHRGYGSGANSWLIHLQVWTAEFFNWNRVELRYCDGASFSGDGENQAAKLKFRGQRIWLAAMDDLMSKGMRNANHALLSGCSAGGLSAILHCDEFRGLFPTSTKVKCLSDAGFFLDAVDISGERTMRDFYSGVVSLQGVQENLPRFCTSHLDPTSCFFPENLIVNITTPLFILNSAYDSWQINNSFAPPSADPHGEWKSCRYNLASCSASQMQILQGFRNQMLNAVKQFSMPNQNGMFINSCLVHCQTENSAWYANESPALGNKTIAEAVGDWYFDRSEVKVVDETCRHLAVE
ncbi:unnamed protein product [Malus baccata var. baccata]